MKNPLLISLLIATAFLAGRFASALIPAARGQIAEKVGFTLWNSALEKGEIPVVYETQTLYNASCTK